MMINPSYYWLFLHLNEENQKWWFMIEGLLIHWTVLYCVLVVNNEYLQKNKLWSL